MIQKSPRDKTSHWFKICFLCLGKYDFGQAQYVKISWEKNSKHYRDLVLCQIEDIEMFKPEEVIRLNSYELLDLEKNISGTSRKTIKKSHISSILTSKLQNVEIRCLLICVFNWFSTTKSPSKKPYWKGFFKCVSKICSVISTIDLPIEKNSDILVKLKWSNFAIHDE